MMMETGTSQIDLGCGFVCCPGHLTDLVTGACLLWSEQQ